MNDDLPPASEMQDILVKSTSTGFYAGYTAAISIAKEYANKQAKTHYQRRLYKGIIENIENDLSALQAKFILDFLKIINKCCLENGE